MIEKDELTHPWIVLFPLRVRNRMRYLYCHGWSPSEIAYDRFIKRFNVNQSDVVMALGFKNIVEYKAQQKVDMRPRYYDTIKEGWTWDEAKQLCIEQYGGKCAVCGCMGKLEVHHMIPFRYCRVHFINDLVLLCLKHHREIDRESYNFVLQNFGKYKYDFRKSEVFRNYQKSGSELEELGRC